MMSLFTTQQIENPTSFTLGRTLGSGSFGEVRVGTHVQSKASYAIKIIPASDDKDEVEAYRNEVRSMESIRGASDSIVGFVQAQSRHEYWYIVMELATGGDLSEGRPFSEDRARSITKDILHGLGAMHRRSLVHRDIKLENVLLKTTADDSPAMITDFGLSAFCNVAEEPLQVRCGSMGYMAPEMTWAKSYGTEVDIWSLGMLVWKMCFITEPPILFEFEGDTECEIEAFPPGLSDNGKAFIKACLNGNPKTRISAEEALQHNWFKQ